MGIMSSSDESEQERLMKVVCPKCRSVFPGEVPEQYAGREARCRQCGECIRISISVPRGGRSIRENAWIVLGLIIITTGIGAISISFLGDKKKPPRTPKPSPPKTVAPVAQERAIRRSPVPQQRPARQAEGVRIAQKIREELPKWLDGEREVDPDKPVFLHKVEIMDEYSGKLWIYLDLQYDPRRYGKEDFWLWADAT